MVLAASPRRFSWAMVAALLGALALPVGAQAGTTTSTEPIFVDLTGVVVEGCDELVRLEGGIRDVLHITEHDDGRLVFVITSNPSGMSGTGLTSGDEYRATGATHQTIAGGPPDETGLPAFGAVTYIDRTRLVGPGDALTLDIRLTFHFTKLDHVNVVHFERFSVTCR